MNLYRVYFQTKKDRNINTMDWAASSVAELIQDMKIHFNIEDLDILKIKFLSR